MSTTICLILEINQLPIKKVHIIRNLHTSVYIVWLVLFGVHKYHAIICFVEAAYTLLLYDELLEWSDRPLREFLNYPMQTEWQRKECLHLTIIQNFDRGKVKRSYFTEWIWKGQYIHFRTWLPGLRSFLIQMGSVCHCLFKQLLSDTVGFF